MQYINELRVDAIADWVQAAAETPGTSCTILTLRRSDTPEFGFGGGEVASWIGELQSLPHDLYDVAIQLVGRFDFELMISLESPPPPRLISMRIDEKEYWPPRFPTPLHIDVTAEIFELRRKYGYPSLPCQWITDGGMNDDAGYFDGIIQPVSVYGYPNVLSSVNWDKVKLSDRQSLILKALREAGAESEVKSMARKVLEQKVAPKLKRGGLRWDIEALKVPGLVASVEGAEGGYWLTPGGRALCISRGVDAG